MSGPGPWAQVFETLLIDVHNGYLVLAHGPGEVKPHLDAIGKSLNRLEKTEIIERKKDVDDGHEGPGEYINFVEECFFHPCLYTTTKGLCPTTTPHPGWAGICVTVQKLLFFGSSDFSFSKYIRSMSRCQKNSNCPN